MLIKAGENRAIIQNKKHHLNQAIRKAYCAVQLQVTGPEIWLFEAFSSSVKYYCNGPKFLDRLIQANNVDPVWSGSRLFAIPLHLLDTLLYGRVIFFKF